MPEVQTLERFVDPAVFEVDDLVYMPLHKEHRRAVPASGLPDSINRIHNNGR